VVAVVDDHRFCCTDGDRDRQSASSTDGGASWRRFGSIESGDHPEELRFGNIAVAAGDVDNLVWSPSDGGAIHHSLDGGDTWRRSDYPGSEAHFGHFLRRQVLTADTVRGGTFYVLDVDGVLRSTDGGATWELTGNQGLPEPAARRRFNATLVATPGREGELHLALGLLDEGSLPLYRSTDGGDSWQEVPGLAEVGRMALGAPLEADGPPALYATGRSRDTTGLWRSGDRGETWDLLSSAPAGRHQDISVLAGDPRSPDASTSASRAPASSSGHRAPRAGRRPARTARGPVSPMAERTATLRAQPDEVASDDRREAPLGPLATVLGQLTVVGSLLFSFGVLYDLLPISAAIVLVVPAVGTVCLAPLERIRRIRVSVPFVCLLGWAGASVTWSSDPDRTTSLLREEMPLLLALILVTGLLSADDLRTALRWTIRIAILVVVASLLTDPATRVSDNADFAVPGWRGSFVAKNSLAIFIVFALSAVLSLERGAWRWPTVAVLGVLLVGSQSVTGWSGAALVVLLTLWLRVLRRKRGRASSFFVVSSSALAGSFAIGVFANYTAILEVYGKDPDLTGRTSIWGPVTDAIAHRPVHGYGWGGLINPQQPAQLTLDLWREIGFQAAHAHNGLLDLVGQLGLVGAALYALILATTVGAAASRLELDPRMASFALVTIAVQLLMSVSENVYLGPWLAVLIVLQAPLLGAPRRARSSSPPAT
jgi:O-antigen ligase